MESWLKNILTLDGVEGGLILLRTGEILVEKGLDQHKAELSELAKRFLRVISLYRKYSSSIREIEIVWQNKRLIGAADDAFIILILCGADTSFPLLRMTLNVTLAQILKDKKTSKILKKIQETKIDHLRVGDLDEIEINLISKLQ